MPQAVALGIGVERSTGVSGSETRMESRYSRYLGMGGNTSYPWESVDHLTDRGGFPHSRYRRGRACLRGDGHRGDHSEDPQEASEARRRLATFCATGSLDSWAVVDQGRLASKDEIRIVNFGLVATLDERANACFTAHFPERRDIQRSSE
jgi:hypothetical protein